MYGVLRCSGIGTPFEDVSGVRSDVGLGIQLRSSNEALVKQLRECELSE